MASLLTDGLHTATVAASAGQPTPAQGALDSAGVGITGGYTGDSLSLQIILALLLGLALFNALELIVLVLVTFQRYQGLYFWSMIISATGIIPYSLGFLIKFFQLLDPMEDIGYLAIVLITIGWWPMITGQAVVLWSRLHLITNSRRVLRWTLYMIITNGIVLHSITSVLTFGSNSNDLLHSTQERFVRGYSIMEKIQMVGFFLQELILSAIYIRETLRLLKLSQTVRNDVSSLTDDTATAQLRKASVRVTMYQLLIINFIIIIMDLVLLAVEFANLYLIETTLKGVVYSIKLKLEFAVLSKLVQLVGGMRSNHSYNHSYQTNSSSSRSRHLASNDSGAQRKHSNGMRLNSYDAERASELATEPAYMLESQSHRSVISLHTLPEIADSAQRSQDVTPTETPGDNRNAGWDMRRGTHEGDQHRRKAKASSSSWIDEEMDKYNIG